MINKVEFKGRVELIDDVVLSNMIKYAVRMIRADYYIPVDQVKFYSDDSKINMIGQAHIGTIAQLHDDYIKGDTLTVNIKSKPIIILCHKQYDDIISKFSTLDEVKDFFKCEIKYIGQDRQGKGLKDSIKRKINRLIRELS